ncbi:hypothetical protein [Pedobacter glucosidilyticus]|uniref:hypothetical protein n=1 Tax=Pedobacter glucosidilyticus TaxID=1122941 RepID=UPI0026EF2779|nr:hypothetical protein [Pedobacter glucosidilyticus]
MKKSILYILLLTGSGLMAQTNPTPVSIPYPAAYSQNFDALDGTVTTYPAGFQGGQVSTSAPSFSGRLNPATADVTLRANGTAATTGFVWDGTGKIGFNSDAGADRCIMLALNTSTVPVTEQINVAFDALVMRNLYDGVSNNFVAGLAFMYRVGTTGNFTLVNNNFITNENAAQNTSNTSTTPVRTVNASFNLPLACSGQPVVQIRWIMREVSGNAGSGSSRPSFAIDNIVARGVSTMPVSFESLTSKLSNQGVDLTWKTLAETNNDKFEIWRAGEDKDFKKIGEVKGKENSTQVNIYSFKDVSPLNGSNYYRLSQTDFDGTTEILAINFVYNGISKLQSSFFYNHDVIHLNIMDKPLEKVQFKILDIKGTKLFDENFYVKEAQDIQLKTQLNKGIYIGILEIDRQVFSRKFVVN